jgi:hypothetical protein
VRLTGQRPCVRTAAFECMREAHRELLSGEQRGGKDITPALAIQVIERAKAHMRQLDLIDSDHDADALEKLLALACRWLARTYQPRKAGAEVWWQIEDLEHAGAILRGRVSNEDNDALVADAQRHGITVTPDQMRALLPVAWLAAAKDILSIGKVRVAAVEGAMRWFNLPSRRSLVAILLAKLRGLDVIQCTDARYGPGCARRYAVTGHSYRLPFVATAAGNHQRRQETAALAACMEQNTYAHGARLTRVGALLRGLPDPHSQQCLDVSSLPMELSYAPLVEPWSVWASAMAISTDSRPSFAF